MRIIYFVVTLALTMAVILLLSSPIGSAPPLGKFISPQQGFWQNAEPADNNFNDFLTFPSLKNRVDVYFDDRLVPHVFGEEEEDVYFVQGYLHAKFRLWQMEFQTHAAAGRLTELLGPGPDSAYLNNDRNMRRVGMVYGAERSLVAMEKDVNTKIQMDAYTAGVNSYITTVTSSSLPLEYRLLNYLPEKWTNLKTALFLKFMSHDLTGYETDIEYTNAKAFFSREDYNKLYPVFEDSMQPIVAKGTPFPEATVFPVVPLNADSLYFTWKDTAAIVATKPDKDNGSNNWVVGGTKTKSGRPILCNDPHLGLNLPSLWYEMQITTASYSTYGVSFPGAPSIIIGFNDSISWGVTNAARDVRDYYQIKFKDDTRSQYWFNNQWKKAEQRVETYVMKDKSLFSDTVAYTVFGPVMYDKTFSGRGRAVHADLAVKWRAHDASNELQTFNALNKAKNYNDYVEAISTFSCPGQNFAFASKEGDIAIWQQGLFPAKWKGQGDFIMPGTDSSYLWQADIPQNENPHVLDPLSGYVTSANQHAADSAYPYYTGGHYDLYRAIAINRHLSGDTPFDIPGMQRLQMNNENVFAETAVPVLLMYLDETMLNAEEKKYLLIIKNWNLKNDENESGTIVFTTWIEKLEQLIWYDELSRQAAPFSLPESYTLIEALKKDASFSFIDNINTPVKETLQEVMTAAFKKSIPVFKAAETSGVFSWNKFKDAGIRHLLRMAPLSRFHLNTGGGENVINATKQFHGPSWRMVVELTDTTQAYGIYPGGQSGNPGSKYYDSFVDDWAGGVYYKLWMMQKNEVTNSLIKSTMTFTADQ